MWSSTHNIVHSVEALTSGPPSESLWSLALPTQAPAPCRRRPCTPRADRWRAGSWTCWVRMCRDRHTICMMCAEVVLSLRHIQKDHFLYSFIYIYYIITNSQQHIISSQSSYIILSYHIIYPHLLLSPRMHQSCFDPGHPSNARIPWEMRLGTATWKFLLGFMEV